MKIAINALPYTHWTGIEVFLANLLRAWPNDPQDEIIVFANQKSAAFLQPLPDHLKIKLVNFRQTGLTRLFLYQQIAFAAELKKAGIDMLLCPSLISPWLYRRKAVIIHDLAPFKFPGESGRPGKIFWQVCLLAAKHFSRGIITVSEFSRREICQYLKIQPDRIINISEGCPAMPLANNQDEKKILEKFSLKEKEYFIYIGNVRPRKNLSNILKAWEKFNAANDYRYQLIIAGRTDERQAALKAWAIENNIRRLSFSGFISDIEKTALLKNSLALLFISKYEGFGLPILEAQSLGVPVITAQASVLPETAGPDGALFADPENIEEIAEKMESIAKNEILRERLISQGKSNLLQYSWEETAKKLREGLSRYHDR